MVKRAFDVLAACVGLVLISPVLMLVAVVIALESRGPIIYRGARTGLHGRTFLMYKFRTMVVDAETRGGPSTGKNDPRVTRSGRFLRAYKLDELPQLVNVVRGEMSLVGPRPEVEEYTRLYTEEEKLILSVRPGITDYSSIRFANLSEIIGSEHPDHEFERSVLPVKNALRLKYVRERSFVGDMRILVNTGLTLIRRGR